MDIPVRAVFGLGSLVFVSTVIFRTFSGSEQRPKTKAQRPTVSLPFYFWRDYDAAFKLPIQKSQVSYESIRKSNG